jgi:hypothetical protein
MEDIALNYGPKVAAWILSLLGLLLSKLVHKFITNITAQGVVDRFGFELKAAVLSVGQTYVSDLRRANEDGVLTDEERAEAKRRAVEAVKAYLGMPGLKALAKVVGLDLDKLDGWIGHHVEAEVARSKPADLVAVGLGPKTQAVARPLA